MSTTKKSPTKKPAAKKPAAKAATAKNAVKKPAAKTAAPPKAAKPPKKPVGPVQVDAVDARPEFDIFTYCELAGETRIEHDLLEELEPRFDDWAAKYLRAYRITDPSAPKGGGHVILWLEEPVEEEIEGIWQDSPSAGMAFHNLAIHMVMSAAQNLVPELADKGCAPLPKPTAGVLQAFEKLGLIWSKEGTVNRQFAVFTREPYSDGCAICILRPKCPNASDD